MAKQLIEAGLVLSGAVLGAAGAVVVEPVVITLGVVAAGVGAYMRFTDQQAKCTEKYLSKY